MYRVWWRYHAQGHLHCKGMGGTVEDAVAAWRITLAYHPNAWLEYSKDGW